MGGATAANTGAGSIAAFQSTLPVGGATSIPHARGNDAGDFNPRSPWGERLFPGAGPCGLPDFNPRSPWGERLAAALSLERLILFQSTFPVGGATLYRFSTKAELDISIHAPRGGSDGAQILFAGLDDVISIHAPRGGSDSATSTAPHGSEISIHAPRGGSDHFSRWSIPRSTAFQSTLPVGGAT